MFVSVWFLILVPSAASTLLVVEYVNQGYTTTQSVAITTIGSVGYVMGACLSIMIADKFERKYHFVIASLIMGIAFILRGLLIHDYVALFLGLLGGQPDLLPMIVIEAVIGFLVSKALTPFLPKRSITAR